MSPDCYPIITIPGISYLLRLLSGLLGLLATELLGGSVLLGPLGTTDGTDTGDSVLTDVTTVAVLSSDASNTLVDPGLILKSAI